MKETHYYLTMQSKKADNVYIDYNRLNGFKITPKNKIKYEGVVVNEMVIINPSFIERILKKKIKRKLDTYLEYIVQILDDTDSYGNLTVKNKTVFYLEYIIECLNTMEEGTTKEVFSKQTVPYIKAIQTLLNEAQRNRVARKLCQSLEPYLDSMLNVLNDTQEFELETVRAKFIFCIQEMFQILMFMDDEDGNIIEMALNDLEKYRRTIINKYQMFLDKHYVELLLKKIGVLERELRLKQVYKEPVYEVDDEEVRKSR